MNVSPGRSTSAPPDPGPAPWSYGLAATLAARISGTRVLRVFIYLRNIDHWSILQEGMGIRRRLTPIYYLERRFVVDFTERKGRTLGASTPTVAGIGFYLLYM